MLSILKAKQADYAGPVDEFANFKEAATFSGLLPEDVMAMMIGTKLSRIKNLTRQGWMDAAAENEPLKDSFRDLAGYAMIAAAWIEQCENAGKGEPTESEVIAEVERMGRLHEWRKAGDGRWERA